MSTPLSQTVLPYNRSSNSGARDTLQNEQFLLEWGAWQVQIAEVGAAAIPLFDTKQELCLLNNVLELPLEELRAAAAVLECSENASADLVPSTNRMETAISSLKKSIEEHCNETHLQRAEAVSHLRQFFDVVQLLPDVYSFCHTLKKEKNDLESRVTHITDELQSHEREVIQLQNLNRKLQEEIDDYDREFGELKNQDRQVRQLQENLSNAQRAFAAQLNAERESLDAEWNHTVAELRQKHQQEMNSLKESLSITAADALSTAREKNCAEESFFIYQQSASNALTAKDAEILLLTSENEQIRGQLTAAELLLAKVSSDQTSSSEHDVKTNIETLNQLVTSLGADLREAKSSHEMARTRLEAQIKTVEASNVILNNQLRLGELSRVELEAELQKRASQAEVAELRQRLREALLSVNETATDARTSSNAQIELANLQEKHILLQKHHDESQQMVEKLEKQVSNLQSLIDRLQETIDHSITNELKDSDSLRFSGFPALDYNAITESIDKQHCALMNGAESLFKATPAVQQPGSELTPLTQAFSHTGSLTSSVYSSSTLLEIATVQKQLYKSKLLQTEQNCEQWKREAENGKFLVSQLHKDNEVLVEKIRYLQKWEPAQTGQPRINLTSESVRPGTEAPSTLRKYYKDCEDRFSEETTDLELNSAVLGARLKSYPLTSTGKSRSKVINEDTSDPFSRFRIAEKLRKLKHLTFIEKAIVLWGSALLSTRVTRIVALVYFVLIHLFVFACHYPYWCKSTP